MGTVFLLPEEATWSGPWPPRGPRALSVYTGSREGPLPTPGDSTVQGPGSSSAPDTGLTKVPREPHFLQGLLPCPALSSSPGLLTSGLGLWFPRQSSCRLPWWAGRGQTVGRSLLASLGLWWPRGSGTHPKSLTPRGVCVCSSIHQHQACLWNMSASPCMDCLSPQERSWVSLLTQGGEARVRGGGVSGGGDPSPLPHMWPRGSPSSSHPERPGRGGRCVG